MLSRPSAPPPLEGGWRSNGSFTKSPLEAKTLRFSLISINSTAVFGGAKIQWNLQQETVRSEDSKLFLWFRSISLLSLEGGEDPMKLASKIRSRRNFWVFRLGSLLSLGGTQWKWSPPPNLRSTTLPFGFRSIFTDLLAEGWWSNKLLLTWV